MDIEKCFEILRVLPDSSLNEVKQAYRDLVNVWHPDRFSHNDRLRKKAEEELKRINFAYQEILKYLSFEQERLRLRSEEEERMKREAEIRAKQQAEYKTETDFWQKKREKIIELDPKKFTWCKTCKNFRKVKRWSLTFSEPKELLDTSKVPCKIYIQTQEVWEKYFNLPLSDRRLYPHNCSHWVKKNTWT
jgi:hypothetical protein